MITNLLNKNRVQQKNLEIIPMQCMTYKPMLYESIDISCRVISTDKQHVRKSVVTLLQEM